MAEPRIYTFRSDVNVVGEVYSTKQGRLIGDAPKDPKVGDIALVDGIIKRCTGTDDAGNPTWEDCDPRVGSIQDDLETVSGSVTDNREDIESNKESIKANAESIEACREALKKKQDSLSGTQLDAVNSGITADKVTEFENKQNALTEEQLAAVNSGINATKVSAYDGYDARIDAAEASLEGKQDKLTAGEGISISEGTISCTLEGVTVDSELKQGSPNPIANSAVYNALQGKASADVATAASNGLMSKEDKAALDKAVTDIAGKLDKDAASVAAEKLTAGTVGSSTSPVYFEEGVPKVCDGIKEAATCDVTDDINETGAGAKLPTVDAVKTAIASGTAGLKGPLVFKGSTDKAPENPSVGDMWNVSAPFELEILGGATITIPAGANIAYSEEGWDKLSETIDLGQLAPAGVVPAAEGKVLLGTANKDKASSAGTVGSASSPIYLKDGVPAVCTTVANATKATEAESAVKDGAGNVIASTYTRSIISSNVTGFAWVQDASAETYGFKGTVAIEGVTAKDIAIVSFSTADAAAGTYSSECETYDGGVTIWAKTQPESLTVPSILIVKG